jgi:DNA repair exonuclease SbcCD nuclease subunit
MKFLHAADIHLDSPLKGLERYEGAPAEKIRLASRAALENLVALAIERKVDFVLLAGDTFDGDGRDWNTALFFVKQMSRLSEAKIPVLMISGNHDAVSKMTRSVKLPQNVTMLGTKKCETVRLEEQQVAVHGQSFQHAAVPENMVPGYPSAVKGWFNIGLLHTSLDYSGGEHPCYAPCKAADLESKEFQYWALGHIHKREWRPQLLAAYPGNVQGRHIKESGAKGCLLVTAENWTEPKIEFQPLDVFRWEQCLVDASGAADEDELVVRFQREAARLSELHEGMPLGLRVTFRGRCGAHGDLARSPERWMNQVRSAVADVAAGNIWVEKVRIETQEEAIRCLPAEDGPLGELSQLVRDFSESDERLRDLSSELNELVAKLPPELKEGADAMPLADPAWLRQLVNQAEPLLIGRLSKEEVA